MSRSIGGRGCNIIAYHGTPCGGARIDNVRFLSGRHAFIPFSRPDDLAVAMEVCQSFAVDNSAYSYWKTGAKLDLRAYYDFVNDVRHHPAFAWAVIPDVIDGTWQENANLIAQWPILGNCGVPVWHLHEPLEWLQRLSSGHWPLIALGSSGQWATPGSEGWWARMGEAMQALSYDTGGGKPRCKLHGLRMLSVDIFTRLPFASADSTNAVRNGNLIGRFGTYPPPTLGQRQAAIADRIEAHQSAAVWQPQPEQPDFFAEEPTRV